jgi:hypothetical protein
MEGQRCRDIESEIEKKIFNGATHTKRHWFSKWKLSYFHTLRLKLTGSSIPFVLLFIRLNDAKRSDEESAEKAIKKGTQLPFIYYLTRGNVSEERKS